MKRYKTRNVYILTIVILSIYLIAGCGDWNDADNMFYAAPMVTLTAPLNNASGIAINTKVTATFSEAMDPLTISAFTFTLAQGLTPVPGTVVYSGLNAVFTPGSTLAPSTTYTATITTGAKNLAGTPLASAYVWRFTTGATVDSTAPKVTLTAPLTNASDIATNTKVTATFSEAMDPLTITASTFTLAQGLTPISGTVSYIGYNAVFTPGSNLAPSTTYTATIATGAKDLAGNPLASAYVWSFTTGVDPDIIAPTVTITSPANLATGVCINKTISATFSESMDPLTLTTASFTVTGVTGVVLYDEPTKIATFNPVGNLLAGTTYIATITTGAKDLAGNPLASAYVWSFTTGATTCATVQPLVAAAPFGGFGGSAGVTNEGLLTVINGDIGTTAASTLVTGFQDSVGDVYTITPLNDATVNGRIYTDAPPPGGAMVGGNAETMAIAQAALLDANTLYNNISPASMPGGVDIGSDQLGGLTLKPGIYTAASGSYQITGVDLTLDADGDSNAIFVFQMASSLTVGGPGAPRSVILIDGAQAKNVYWQVGSAATINGAGGGTMVGTIIAYSAVSFSTSGNVDIVTLEGRAMSLTGSVTMTNTYVNVPAP